MNENLSIELAPLDETEFWKSVLIVFVAFAEKAKHTACWKGLDECSQTIASLDWIAYQTGMVSELKNPDPMHLEKRIEKHTSNLGLGVCFNLAAKQAKTLGKKWLCFFDSDFLPTLALLRTYFKSVSNNTRAEIFIPQVKSGDFTLSPYQTFLGRYRISAIPLPGILQPQIWFWINNGMLVENTLFEKVGGFHPDIIADFSDTLFCYRVKKVNPKIMLLPTVLDHRHSAFDQMSQEKALARFRVYCLGSKISAREMLLRPHYFFWALMRALRLSFRFGSLTFLPIPFQSQRTMLEQITHA